MDVISTKDVIAIIFTVLGLFWLGMLAANIIIKNIRLFKARWEQD